MSYEEKITRVAQKYGVPSLVGGLATSMAALFLTDEHAAVTPEFSDARGPNYAQEMSVLEQNEAALKTMEKVFVTYRQKKEAALINIDAPAREVLEAEEKMKIAAAEVAERQKIYLDALRTSRDISEHDYDRLWRKFEKEAVVQPTYEQVGFYGWGWEFLDECQLKQSNARLIGSCMKNFHDRKEDPSYGVVGLTGLLVGGVMGGILCIPFGFAARRIGQGLDRLAEKRAKKKKQQELAKRRDLSGKKYKF